MFWIITAGLTGLTCLALLAALGRSAQRERDHDHDKDFYTAQLAEIDRQGQLGLIAGSEAEAARAEAARRLLSVQTKFSGTSTNATINTQKRAGTLTVLLVPGIALPLYLMLGAPSMPSFPLASRQVSPVVAEVGEGRTSSELDFDKAVLQIETHLSKNPEDGRGYEVVAPVYLRLGRHDDAVKAFKAALLLLGKTPSRMAGLGEALVYQANGRVTEEARIVFEDVIKHDPDHIRAQFFLAMEAQQEGDPVRARHLLQTLSNRLPEGPLKQEVNQQLSQLAPAATNEAVIASMPKDEQMQAIRGMVEGLAQRLAQSGGSADEWVRLVWALTVLNEKDRVIAILQEARTKFAGMPDELRRIEEAGNRQP